MFETILHPIFSPLLKLPPVVGILIISLLISIIITVVYKYMTDQTMMKDVKTRQKELQKKMKELRNQPEKLMKVQKEAMDLNLKYMSQSFKPTLITFLPIIIIFGWLNANLAFEPIQPGQEFTTTLMFKEGFTGNVTITVPEGVTLVGDSVTEIKDRTAAFGMKAIEGDYLLVFSYEGKSYDKELTVTSEQRYAPAIKTFSKEPLQSVTLSNQKLIAINLFGKDEGSWSAGRFGWLFTYIIFSLLFSFGIRKLMKVY
jgi:uncharacterized membrane protein (DUF106 family)